ncbi:MAG: hypothetical protein DDT19_00017 [Syntrophomonadaceae bacterium]|nr:hypothetical protein [Bacillota bacterium]
MSILTTVNASLKHPITEEKIVEILLTGNIEKKWFEHIAVFFTEVHISDIMLFIKKYDVPIDSIKSCYLKNIKELYPNKELEEALLIGSEGIRASL